MITLPYPHDKQKEYILDQHRFKALNWGRRGGKSSGVGTKNLLKAMEKQGNYYIIAPTYKQVKSIYWSDIVKTLFPKEIVHATNEQELWVELKPLHYKVDFFGWKIDTKHDPDKPYSRIYLKGADNPDSLRGVALDGASLDEFAFMKNGMELWQKIIRPALADREGWADFISTPDGIHNAWYEICQVAQRNPAWFYSHATALDNPYFPKTEWDLAKAEYESEGKTDEWVQEWEALFAVPSKLVYKEFRQATHVIDDPRLMPSEGTYALGMDFGFEHPFAAVFVLIDYDQNWWIYDEIYMTHLHPDQQLSALKPKISNTVFTKIIGDAQAKAELALLRKNRIWVQPSAKGAVKSGIQLVRQKLAVREGTGKPKLFILRRCKNTIREFESYSNLPDAWGGTSDIPEDRNNHAMDALRYLVVSQHEALTPRKPRARSYDPTTGRVLS